MTKSGFNKNGLCRLCKLSRTDKGHDPCIANLPGVIFACCGHGMEKGYIKFEDGRCMEFNLLNVTLDAPQHEVVRKSRTVVPLFIKGESYRVLYTDTGDIAQEHGRFNVDGPGKTKVRMRKKK